MTIKGDPWFVAADVARALGFVAQEKAGAASYTQAIRKEDLTTVRVSFGRRRIAFDGNALHPNTVLISEPGLYTLAFRAHRSNAVVQAFVDWVTGVVLPSIRRDGMYVAGEEKLATGEMSEAEFLDLAIQAARRKVDQAEADKQAVTPLLIPSVAR